MSEAKDFEPAGFSDDESVTVIAGRRHWPTRERSRAHLATTRTQATLPPLEPAATPSQAPDAADALARTA
jgi:hypothetical protein